MICRVIVAFEDLKEGVTRNIGDTFEATQQRAKELASYGFVEVEPKKRQTKK